MSAWVCRGSSSLFFSSLDGQVFATTRVTVIPPACWQLVAEHNAVPWAPIKETQSFQNDVSEVLLSYVLRERENERYQCPPRGDWCLKKSYEKEARHCRVLCKHLILGLVFSVSFRPCWSRAQLRQLNGPLSIPSPLRSEARQNSVWCRRHGLFKAI